MGIFGPPDVERMKARRDIKGLMKTLGCQKDPDLRMAAARALGEFSEGLVVDALVTALNDENPWVRQNAAVSLGQIGDVRAVEPLIEYIRREPGQSSALEALTKFKDPRAIDTMVASLIAPQSKMREVALQGLEAMKWKPTLPGDKAAYLIAQDKWTKIAQLGPAAVDILILALNVADYYINDQAAIMLGKIGDARAVQPLIKRLRPGYGHLMVVIVKSLEQLGDPIAVPRLLQLLKENVVGLPAAAASAIIAISAESSIDALINVLHDPDPFVLKTAASALVKIGKSALEPLKTVLAGKNPFAQHVTADILSRIGYKPDDSSAGIIYCILREDWQSCVQIGQPAVDLLVAALGERNNGIRRTAAKALGEIGDPRAVSPLIKHCAGYVDQSVVNNALAALGKLGDSRAIPTLLPRLKHPELETRRIAATALVTLYQSGKLLESDQQLVLTQRQIITQSHEDHDLVRGGSDCHSEVYGHKNEGIGIPFPV